MSKKRLRMELRELDIYRSSRELSRYAWEVYCTLSLNDQRLYGNQWLRAIDSMGANIAEGFGRFHYLDRNQFNYHARGSLMEAIHWTELLYERGRLKQDEYKWFMERLEQLRRQLNAYIRSTRDQTRK